MYSYQKINNSKQENYNNTGLIRMLELIQQDYPSLLIHLIIRWIDSIDSKVINKQKEIFYTFPYNRAYQRFKFKSFDIHYIRGKSSFDKDYSERLNSLSQETA